MRTLTARSTAVSVRNELAAVASSRPETGRTLLATLAARPGWFRASELEFVHSFGSRRSEIAIPVGFDVRIVAALATRAEINTLLGDCEWSVLSELQALAARELRQFA